MKNITIKQHQLFNRENDGLINIWEKNRLVLLLINLKAKAADLIFDKEVRLKKAFNKAYEEAIEGRTKLLEAHSKKTKVTYLDGREEETMYVVDDIKKYIEDLRQQINLFDNKQAIESITQEIAKYEEVARTKDLKKLNDFGKSILVKTIDDKKADGKKVVFQNYNLENLEEYNKEFKEFLEKEITLDCLPIKMASLLKEDCTSLNGAMEFLEDFISA